MRTPYVQSSAMDISKETLEKVKAMNKELHAIGVEIGLQTHDDVEYLLPAGVTFEQVEVIRKKYFPDTP